MFKVRLHLAKCSMKIFGKQRLVFRDFFQSSNHILCYIALGISRPTGLQIGLLLTGGVWKIVSCSIQRNRRIVTLAAVFYIAHSRETFYVRWRLDSGKTRAKHGFFDFYLHWQSFIFSHNLFITYPTCFIMCCSIQRALCHYLHMTTHFLSNFDAIYCRRLSPRIPTNLTLTLQFINASANLQWQYIGLNRENVMQSRVMQRHNNPYLLFH